MKGVFTKSIDSLNVMSIPIQIDQITLDQMIDLDVEEEENFSLIETNDFLKSIK